MCKSTTLDIQRTNNIGISNAKCNRRRLTIIFAKLGIASGLLSLLASVTVYGLEENIHKSIEHNSATNQQLYRLKKIDEYYYHTQLKYSTLQKLCEIIRLHIDF